MLEMRDPSLPKAVFLMGPTASGKTDLAVALRQRFPFEIISVDSALIYRDMDIGTAKPDAELLARAPHRLIDIRDPAQPYSVAEFCEDALREMADIVAAGRIPLLVGGTMMYFKALRQGLADMPGTNEAVRERLQHDFDRLGPEFMHARLSQVDPVAAAQIHAHNRQRVLRALEVFEVSGRPISSFWEGSTPGHPEDEGYTNWNRESFAGVPYNIINLAVSPTDRSELHRRIELRFRNMLDAGFLDEVRRLHARGDLHTALPAVRAVGYRQAWDFLDGLVDEAAMTAKAVAATRQLAKRQLTWLRGWPSLTWLESGDPQLVNTATDVLAQLL